jgi:hypothetical protein
MTRLDCRLADSALVLPRTGTDSSPRPLVNADAATARTGPTGCSGSDQISWRIERRPASSA